MPWIDEPDVLLRKQQSEPLAACVWYPPMVVRLSRVASFISRYRREVDFFEMAASLCAQELRAALRENGIRAIVTSRAKDVDALRLKLKRRDKEKNYSNSREIYQDIPDLAGARVALYFPQDRFRVESIILDRFHIEDQETDIRRFPNGKEAVKAGKRFSGYCATHYRVRLKEENLADSQKRYAEARIEIQVASVLMHAWAEVEHDLSYKPTAAISPEEEAILDELNGLVMTGEIALERLQQAAVERTRSGGFASHYELAAHILRRLASRAESD